MAGNPSDYLAGGQQQGGAPGGDGPSAGGGGMPTDVDQREQEKPDQNTLLQDALNFLGKGTALQQPGTVAQPLTGGIASSPAAAFTPGNQGEGMGAGGGRANPVGGGSNLAGLLGQGLGLGVKGYDFIKSLLDPSRGGEGEQTSDQSLSDRLRTGSSPSMYGDVPTSDILAQFPGLSTSPDNLSSFISPTGELSPGVTFSKLENTSGNLSPADLAAVTGANTSSGSGTGAGLNAGTAIGGAGLLGGALGMVGSGTGNQALGITGSAIGVASNLANLIRSGVNISNFTSIPGLIMAAASPFIKPDMDNAQIQKMISGALTALSANPYTAIAASILNTAMTIYGGLNSKQTPEQQTVNAIWASTPFGLIDSGIVGEQLMDAVAPNSADWRSFTTRLGQNESQQGKALSTLAQALPYVGSKEELGQLLNTYKNYLTTTTGLQMTGGSGSEGNLYGIGTIPGTSGYEHMTSPSATAGQGVDWGPQTAAIQGMIDKLLTVLPGEQITKDYASGGGLTGATADRLWNQFRVGDSYGNTSIVGATGLPSALASQTKQTSPGGWTYDQNSGQYTYVEPTQETTYGVYTDKGPQYMSLADIQNGQAAGTVSTQLQWDPNTGKSYYVMGKGPQKASDYYQQTPYWQQLIDQQAAAQQAPGMAGGLGAAPASGAINNSMDEIIRKAALSQ